MKLSKKLLSTAGVLTLAVLGAQPALAAQTTAGTTITNTVSVDFQVGGFSQTQQSASDTLTVDRKVNVTVAEVGTTTTTVSPGQTAAVTTFTVTNLSNAVLDFALTATQQTGGAGAHSNTDSFDVTNVKIYKDANANGVYDAGTDTLVTYLDELGADTGTATVFVVADIPLSLTTGNVAAVTLTATGREGGTAGTQGIALVQTTGANTSGMDTVFADAAGATDAARDAAFSAKDDYTISAAALTAVKTSTIISDPVNGTTNAKFIPGATLQYCIAVTNAAGSATATTILIQDPLPAGLTYDAGYGIKINGTVTSGVCNTDGATGGSFASNKVSGTLTSVAATETKTLLFRATIN
ncbi:hypothetical protein [Novosphingobium lentum]|uniref:hypothetical protein n=1 Tax=Novosphingobium lentum TaxID=145287 RepID=UPI000831C3D8|nr:hypothetical protein [Novosphingobium lentum]